MAKSNYLYAGLIPEHEVMVSNILEIFDNASKADIADGASWYPRAFELSESISELTGYSTAQVAGLMALTSATTGWNVNNAMPARLIKYAETDHAGKRPGFLTGTSATWKSVLKVLEGDLAAVTGPKRQAFYAAIMGDRESVTVDRHAMRIAVGGGMYDSAPIGVLRKIQRAYTDAAEQRGIAPRDMQAITWVAYRRMRDLEKIYG